MPLPFPGGSVGVQQILTQVVDLQDFQVIDVVEQASGVSATVAIPAGRLSADGDSLLVIASGQSDGGDDLRVRFGGSTIFTGSLSTTDEWFMVLVLTRTGASAQSTAAMNIRENGSTRVQNRVTSAVDLSVAQDLVLDYSTTVGAARAVRFAFVGLMKA